ncbi:hypothetical protein MGH68_00960 [Erysipelothrix sp. D19-032]
MTDMISITLRCDFPHDTWWNQVSMSFDDGSEAVFETVKTDARQVFKFEAKTITSLTMHSLIKGEPGPFPPSPNLKFLEQTNKIRSLYYEIRNTLCEQVHAKWNV